MEEAQPILEYLPNSFKEPGEKEYIEFLWDAFAANYEIGKYQMALLPYHMLYMSYVYFSIWQIKLMRPKDFSHAAIFQKNEKQVMAATSPFTFYRVAEGEVFKFLRIIGCDEEQTAPFSGLVAERNKLAHANGMIVCANQASADAKIAEILKQVRAIQSHMTPVLYQCLQVFLLDSSTPGEEREYEDPADQIRELLVRKNYFSLKDIEGCMTFDVQTMSDEPQFAEIKVLFEEFIMLYAPEFAA
ncbi:hypothetical protein [Rhodoferax sp.]|uniref:hypothetical protein n=1 Tax=Rhodoferax sp. TaxID=50421 RepID=UPI00374D89C7